MGTRSQLTYFLNGDKLEPLKIILSPFLVNISDGDKIAIDIFFEWGQDWIFENYLVPMLSKNFLWEQDKILRIILSPCIVNISDGDNIPINIFFEWGQDRTLENHIVPKLSKYFWWGQDLHWHIFWIGKKLNLWKLSCPNA